MPQTTVMGGQDWDTVNAGRSGVPGAKVVAPKTAREITQAKAAGLIATEKRHGAGGNKSAHPAGIGISAKKLEEADDVGTIAKVDKSLSIAIMQVCC
jgi:Multiprotein bridging factor 1